MDLPLIARTAASASVMVASISLALPATATGKPDFYKVVVLGMIGSAGSTGAPFDSTVKPGATFSVTAIINRQAPYDADMLRTAGVKGWHSISWNLPNSRDFRAQLGDLKIYAATNTTQLQKFANGLYDDGQQRADEQDLQFYGEPGIRLNPACKIRVDMSLFNKAHTIDITNPAGGWSAPRLSTLQSSVLFADVNNPYDTSKAAVGMVDRISITRMKGCSYPAPPKSLTGSAPPRARLAKNAPLPAHGYRLLISGTVFSVHTPDGFFDRSVKPGCRYKLSIALDDRMKPTSVETNRDGKSGWNEADYVQDNPLYASSGTIGSMKFGLPAAQLKVLKESNAQLGQAYLPEDGQGVYLNGATFVDHSGKPAPSLCVGVNIYDPNGSIDIHSFRKGWTAPRLDSDNTGVWFRDTEMNPCHAAYANIESISVIPIK